MEKFAVHPKHDSKEHGKKHKLGRKAIEQVVRNNYTFRLLLWEKQNHTNTATTPCPEKEDYTTGKTTRIHSEKSKRMKQTAALETKDPNSYIPIYSPKRLGRMGRQQGERTHYPNVSST
ncbi:hypothetical protein K0F29_16730 [Phocaeicola vulgatus]|uniref:hypothetical protein n=1 Tax=Phocaeicola vulgatus TaxID=821 RepID=UPI001F389EBC|nr:hypothetical protein [Phocaeicola vulgatus]MCE8729801.1 hypothetical protein [Phocaeicola vulgatus]